MRQSRVEKIIKAGFELATKHKLSENDLNLFFQIARYERIYKRLLQPSKLALHALSAREVRLNKLRRVMNYCVLSFSIETRIEFFNDGLRLYRLSAGEKTDLSLLFPQYVK